MQAPQSSRLYKLTPAITSRIQLKMRSDFKINWEDPEEIDSKEDILESSEFAQLLKTDKKQLK